jgi:hypothetical protein
MQRKIFNHRLTDRFRWPPHSAASLLQNKIGHQIGQTGFVTASEGRWNKHKSGFEDRLVTTRPRKKTLPLSGGSGRATKRGIASLAAVTWGFSECWARSRYRTEGHMSSARKALVGLLDKVGAGNTLRRVRRWRRGRRKYWTPLVPEQPFAACCRMAIEELAKQAHEFGDYLEFGVRRGTSFAAMHDVLIEKGLNTVRLFGFDSFEGLPPEAAKEGWKAGDFNSAISATRKYLKERGIDWTRSILIKGWFKDTLNDETIRKFNIERASLVMVDCDIYSASRDALWFSEPLIRDHAVIFFDDWGAGPPANRIGQIEAFDEFLGAFPHLRAVPMPSYTENARVFLVSRI